MKIKVSVPATSANVGSGFDALGLAVTLYNTVTFEESDHLEISSADGTRNFWQPQSGSSACSS